jgi:hypothetical protein
MIPQNTVAFFVLLADQNKPEPPNPDHIKREMDQSYRIAVTTRERRGRAFGSGVRFVLALVVVIIAFSRFGLYRLEWRSISILKSSAITPIGQRRIGAAQRTSESAL